MLHPKTIKTGSVDTCVVLPRYIYMRVCSLLWYCAISGNKVSVPVATYDPELQFDTAIRLGSVSCFFQIWRTPSAPTSIVSQTETNAV